MNREEAFIPPPFKIRNCLTPGVPHSPPPVDVPPPGALLLSPAPGFSDPSSSCPTPCQGGPYLRNGVCLTRSGPPPPLRAFPRSRPTADFPSPPSRQSFLTDRPTSDREETAPREASPQGPPFPPSLTFFRFQFFYASPWFPGTCHFLLESVYVPLSLLQFARSMWCDPFFFFLPRGRRHGFCPSSPAARDRLFL